MSTAPASQPPRLPALLLLAAFAPALAETCLFILMARCGVGTDLGLLAPVAFVAVASLLGARPAWCRQPAAEPCAASREPRLAMAGLLSGGLWLLLAYDGMVAEFTAGLHGLSFGPVVDGAVGLVIAGSLGLGLLLGLGSALALLYLAIGPPRGRRLVA